MTEPAEPAGCAATSTFCSGDSEWTFHCAAGADHAPGEHDYQIDDGQPPLPTNQED